MIIHHIEESQLLSERGISVKITVAIQRKRDFVCQQHCEKSVALAKVVARPLRSPWRSGIACQFSRGHEIEARESRASKIGAICHTHARNTFKCVYIIYMSHTYERAPMVAINRTFYSDRILLRIQVSYLSHLSCVIPIFQDFEIVSQMCILRQNTFI